MKFSVVTVLPEMLNAICDYGVTSRALKKGLIDVSTVNPREFTTDKHRTVDDRPYGGGPGMVMMLEPLRQAIHQAKTQTQGRCKVVYVSPQGAVFNQQKAKDLAASGEHIILLAGRYEGVDQRLIDQEIDEEISLGDFVVSGGELPAMMIIDAVARCLPGVLGHQDSAVEDSFFDGLLDHPHYTRPEVDETTEAKVVDVLLSGNHEKIRRWRLQQALGQTWLKRPDLLTKRSLSTEEQVLLADFQQEWQNKQT